MCRSLHESFVLAILTLQRCHNEHDGVSNHQGLNRLLNRLFSSRSKKTSKLCVTGLCEGNPPVTGGFCPKGPVMLKTFPFDDIIMRGVYCGYFRKKMLHCNRMALYWQSLLSVKFTYPLPCTLFHVQSCCPRIPRDTDICRIPSRWGISVDNDGPQFYIHPHLKWKYSLLPIKMRLIFFKILTIDTS